MNLFILQIDIEIFISYLFGSMILVDKRMLFCIVQLQYKGMLNRININALNNKQLLLIKSVSFQTQFTF